MIRWSCRSLALTLTVSLVVALSLAAQQNQRATTEGDFTVKNFKFRSGESLPELRLHYTTLGKPARDAQGRVTNAVLILHGTGGSGEQFLQPQFTGNFSVPGNSWTRVATSSLFLTALVTGNRRSRATACTRISLNTITTTWFWPNTSC